MNDTGAKVDLGFRSFHGTLMDQGEGRDLGDQVGLLLYVKSSHAVHIGIWGVPTEEPPFSVPEAGFKGIMVSMGRYKDREDVFVARVRASREEAEKLLVFLERFGSRARVVEQPAFNRLAPVRHRVDPPLSY